MPCDTRRRQGQSFEQRREEVRSVVARVVAQLATGRYRVVVDRQTGAVAFAGLADEDRAGVTDACIYRLVMATGTAQAKLAIARAEQMAGRSVSREALAQHVHSHDGGASWHHGH